MNVRKWLSQGLAGLALALATGAVLCASGGEARAAIAIKSPCDCTSDSCVLTPTGICCNGFCNCTDNGCGCSLYTPPEGATIPRCMV